MGFRLSSAIAGFAERTSENLTALQDKADEITKTAAERYANEALQVRKERMKNIREYTKKAKNLSNLGLNNAQIETLLSGGVEQADKFEQGILFARQRAELKGETFNMEDTINTIFGERNIEMSPEGTSRTIAEQAKLFAQAESPFIGADAETIGKQVSAATKTLFSPEGISPEYSKSQFQVQAQAAGGTAPETMQTDRAFGTDTGYTTAGLAQFTDPSVNLSLLNQKQQIDLGELQMKETKQAMEVVEQNLEFNREMHPLQKKQLISSIRGNNQKWQLDSIRIQNERIQKNLNEKKYENYISYGANNEKLLNEANIKIAQKELTSADSISSHLGELVATRTHILRGENPDSEENKKLIEGIDKAIDFAITKDAMMQDSRNSNAYGTVSSATLSTIYEGMVDEEFEAANIVTNALGEMEVVIDGVKYKDTDSGENLEKFKEIKNKALLKAQNRFKEAAAPEGQPVTQAADIIIKSFQPVDVDAKKEKAIKPTNEEILNMGVDAYLDNIYKEISSAHPNRQKVGNQLKNIFKLDDDAIINLLDSMEEKYPIEKEEVFKDKDPNNQSSEETELTETETNLRKKFAPAGSTFFQGPTYMREDEIKKRGADSKQKAMLISQIFRHLGKKYTKAEIEKVVNEIVAGS
tara:strand:+ start:273 stop:2198 length:1926 start_codon:yes stop_codon:yes gene_type:complete